MASRATLPRNSPDTCSPGNDPASAGECCALNNAWPRQRLKLPTCNSLLVTTYGIIEYTTWILCGTEMANKLIQCGVGRAILVAFETPVTLERELFYGRCIA